MAYPPFSPSQQASPHQRTLLYVEDNAANMALVGQLLVRRGDLKFLTAIDGDLGMLMARTYVPAVILMDINLPGKSGYDVLELLHDDPLTAHIPIIALSSNAYPHDIERGLHAGFFRYLTKPYKINAFFDSLDAALNIVPNSHHHQ